MDKNDSGRYYISQVTLYPQVNFSGDNIPTQDDILVMHEKAHQECFIANSVKTNVLCHPLF